ncbi:HAD family hydrolase [Mesobacillus subterraneus]|uniref:HAD family hydrolase n=1 Tax=Mesobacillus subterraneus TaxID=285983 RepID=UPI00203A748F|nr:HAD family hydrolase [Mesobacillus subterraneus]MCM3666375.1 HAD family hydrolase [Mesobacillus subterraneus]MCM3685353.1 HAD family hydrolase [Mesobacillus subterraneus]
MKTSKFSGVVFDLWNTLVPLPNHLKEQAFRETSATLGYDDNEFQSPWAVTRTKRETGDLLEYLYWLRNELSAEWSNETINAAMEVRKTIHGSAFLNPDREAIEVLRTLKMNGYKVGLISNCSSDVRDMITTSELGQYIDTLVLSSELGIMKPDERIFKLAASKLGVSCSECLYIGDGHDNELEGAENVGMEAVLIDRGDGRKWDKKVVNSLSSILKEVGLA